MGLELAFPLSRFTFLFHRKCFTAAKDCRPPHSMCTVDGWAHVYREFNNSWVIGDWSTVIIFIIIIGTIVSMPHVRN